MSALCIFLRFSRGLLNSESMFFSMVLSRGLFNSVCCQNGMPVSDDTVSSHAIFVKTQETESKFSVEKSLLIRIPFLIRPSSQNIFLITSLFLGTGLLLTVTPPTTVSMVAPNCFAVAANFASIYASLLFPRGVKGLH